MTEVHIKESLGTLDITLARYSGEREEAWDVELSHKRKAIEITVEDLEHIKRKVDEMIEEARQVEVNE